MPINPNPYGPILESTQGLATLGELAGYKAKLDEMRSLNEERKSTTAFRNQEVADRQRTAQEQAQRQSLVQSIVPKHLRQDGSLDQTGLLNELSASGDLGAYQAVAKSLGETNKALLEQQKADREEKAAKASEVERLTRGLDTDPALAAINLPKIRQLSPEMADYIGDGSDPTKIQNVRQQALDYKDYHQEVTDLQKKSDTVKGQAFAQLAAAKTPEQVHDAFMTLHLVGADHDAEKAGLRPDTYNPETGRVTALSQIPGMTAVEMARLTSPQTASTSSGSDYSRFLADYMSAESAKLGKTPEQLSPQERVKIQLGAKKAFGQADDRPPASAASAGGPDLTPESLALMGADYRIKGTPALPTRFTDADKKRIINEGSAQAKALGQAPVVTIQKQAAYKGDAASLARMRLMSDTANAAEQKAFMQSDLISDLSEKVGRTGSPALNKWLLTGKQDVLGDTDTKNLANAIQTFTSEYGKIIEGSTGSVQGSSDASRAAARRLIDASLSKGTMRAVVEQMKKEMEYARLGNDAVIEHITNRMGGAPPVATPPPGSAPPVGGQVDLPALRKSYGY